MGDKHALWLVGRSVCNRIVWALLKGAKDSKISTALVEFSLLCSLKGGVKVSLSHLEPLIRTALVKD